MIYRKPHARPAAAAEGGSRCRWWRLKPRQFVGAGSTSRARLAVPRAVADGGRLGLAAARNRARVSLAKRLVDEALLVAVAAS